MRWLCFPFVLRTVLCRSLNWNIELALLAAHMEKHERLCKLPRKILLLAYREAKTQESRYLINIGNLIFHQDTKNNVLIA